MRKILLVLVLIACVPLATFAAGSDFQLGVSAMYPLPLLTENAPSEFQANLISPGLEARLRLLHVLQLGGNVTLLCPFAEDSEGTMMLAPLDAGLCLDLFLVRLGAGIGPTVYFEGLDGGWGIGLLWNFRLSAEIQLGKVSLGASARYLFSDFELIDYWINYPWFSATLLFKL